MSAKCQPAPVTPLFSPPLFYSSPFFSSFWCWKSETQYLHESKYTLALSHTPTFFLFVCLFVYCCSKLRWRVADDYHGDGDSPLLIYKRKWALTIYQLHTWTSQALSSTGSSPFEPIHAFLVKVLYDHPYFTNGKTEAQRGEVNCPRLQGCKTSCLLPSIAYVAT